MNKVFKQSIFLAIVVSFASIVLTSCLKDKKEDYLNVSPTSLYFEWGDGYFNAQRVSISSNYTIWQGSSISTSSGWCHYLIDVGSQTLSIWPDENTSSSSRSASVVISAGTLQRTIEVHQKGMTALSAPSISATLYNMPDGPPPDGNMNYHVGITWNSIYGFAGYRVYRSNSANGTYSQIGSNTTNTFYDDYNPHKGENYYKVKAFVNSNESEFSNYVFIYVPE